MSSLTKVSWFFYISRNVSGTYPKSWFPTWVSSFNHGVTTSCKDSRNTFVVHKRSSCFHRWLCNPLNTVFRRSSCDSCVTNDLSCVSRRFLSWWVEGKHDWITCFQSNQWFENCCWCWVCCWSDTTHNTDRFCNFSQSCNGIIFDNSDSFNSAHVIHNMFTGKKVFCRLVFKYTTTSFFNCMLC